MSFFSKLSRGVITALLIIGAIPLLFMMILVVGNSLGRALFRTPIYGSIEIAGLAGAIVVAAAVGFTARERGNVAVDVLMSRLRPRARACFDAVTYTLSLVGLAYLFWAIVVDLIDCMEQQETTPTLDISTIPFKISWAIGIFIVGCFLLSHVVTAIRKIGKR